MACRVQDRQKRQVLLADDHPLVRQGLREIVEEYEDLEVVGEAADGLQAVNLTAIFHPDVVLMDVNMPTMDGIQATSRIKRDYPCIVVIGLSAHVDRYKQEAILEAGAVTLLRKETASDQLYPAIHSALGNA